MMQSLSGLSRFALFLLASVFLMPGGRAESEAELTARLAEANAKFEAGEFGAAINGYSRILDAMPRAGNVWVLRALAKWNLKDYNGAEADIAQALALNAKNVDAYRIRAGVRLDRNEFFQAYTDIEKAIALRPDDAELLTMRGEIQNAQADIEAVIRDTTRAIELQPDYVPAHFLRARAHQETGNRSAALADFSRVIELDPGNDEALERRARIHLGLGNWAGAGEDAKRALELNPERVISRRLLGYALFGAEDHAGAASALGDAAQRAKDDVRNGAYLLFVRDLALQRVGERDDRLARAVATWPEDSWPRALGSFLTGAMTEEALDELALAPEDDIERTERSCEADFYIGMRRLAAGDRSTARLRFQSCISTELKNFTEYILAEAELKRLRK
jgi:tetratricopeptide (TPR) repeat protein